MENLIVHSSFCFRGLAPLILSWSGSPCRSCGWTMFGTRKMGAWRVLTACDHTEPRTFQIPRLETSSHSLVLSHRSALTVQCELHRLGDQALILPCPLPRFLFLYLLNFCDWILNHDYHLIYITKLWSSLVLPKAIHVLHRISVIRDVLNWKFKIKKQVLKCIENKPFYQF